MRYRESNTATRLKISSAVWIVHPGGGSARANLWIGKTEQQLGEASDAQKHGSRRRALTPAVITAARPRHFNGTRSFCIIVADEFQFDLPRTQDADSWMRRRSIFRLERSHARPARARPRFVPHRIMEFGPVGNARLEFEICAIQSASIRC